MYNISMIEHIKNLFEPEEKAQIARLIEDEKAKRKLFVWNEFAGEKFPQEIIDDSDYMIQNISLGKIMFNITIPESIKEKLVKTAKYLGADVGYFCATYTEYSGKYGKPVLTPHKDRQDFCLIDYQLDANTSWPLYIDDQEYDLSNNDGLIFFPARSTHGRIEKDFTNDDYVKMIFFDMQVLNK